MEFKKNDTNLSQKESASKSCRVDETLGETIARVFEQIEIECFDKDDSAKARELCYIIAEVYRLDPYESVKVDGHNLSAGTVAATFELITNEHIKTVIRKNDERDYPVKYKKAYLRTLLYNSVFEYSSANLEDF